jgi:hypothetical protein
MDVPSLRVKNLFHQNNNNNNNNKNQWENANIHASITTTTTTRPTDQQLKVGRKREACWGSVTGLTGTTATPTTKKKHPTPNGKHTDRQTDTKNKSRVCLLISRSSSTAVARRNPPAANRIEQTTIWKGTGVKESNWFPMLCDHHAERRISFRENYLVSIRQFHPLGSFFLFPSSTRSQITFGISEGEKQFSPFFLPWRWRWCWWARRVFLNCWSLARPVPLVVQRSEREKPAECVRARYFWKKERD